jgi:hypothetical protein
VTCGDPEVESRIEAKADELVAMLEKKPQEAAQVSKTTSSLVKLPCTAVI